MANTNFVIAVAPVKVAAFKDVVIKQAEKFDIVLIDRIKLGNGQIWSIKGLEKPTPSAIGYVGGKVVFQNLNPARLDIECRFIEQWANAQSK